MKKLFLLGFLASALLGCKDQSKTTEVNTESSYHKTAIDFPFSAKYSINWQQGDENNALLVLNSLKKYVEGDLKGCGSYFADTAEFVADKFHFRGSKDSLMAILGVTRNGLASVSKTFDSWQTSYYPDQKDTWVALWYTEKWTDKNGKTDSMYYMDDVLIKDGKILLYDEKQRQFPEPAPKK